MWTEVPKKGKVVTKDRFVSKMFLRGDSVVIVLRNPLGGPGKGKPASTKTQKRKDTDDASDKQAKKAKTEDVDDDNDDDNDDKRSTRSSKRAKN